MPVQVRLTNKDTLPEQFAQRLAELANEVAKLSRHLGLIESDRDIDTAAQQTELTIHSYDDETSIQFLTENGFVIVRPWEADQAMGPGEGAFRFRVQDPWGIEREIGVRVSTRLLHETAQRARGRIEPSSQFWICCAERRLANYLMEQGEFPPANEIIIDTLDREDVLLTIRWGKSG